jgi:hypothetical protein
MFRKNQSHLQASLTNDLDLLTKKQRKRLDESWAGVFRREVFSRVDETPFAVLYSDTASRPNIAVNVLFGLEILKAGYDWSDEEMHDAFSFDVQVRYALGYDNLGQGEFDLRTVYNFRQRLSEHQRQTGENLIERAFRQITDEQLHAFQLKSGRLRMDSTQIASNIRYMTRLHLMVEMLQRAHRILSPADQARYAEAFAPYLKGSTSQFIYHVKKDEARPYLQRIGDLLHRLLVELRDSYSSQATYALLERVFHEQFVLRADVSQPKPHDDADGPPLELRSESGDAVDSPSQIPPPVPPPAQGDASAEPPVLPSSPVEVRPGRLISTHGLLSPDDPDATYRRKGARPFRGYVTNLTETSEPANPFQLIVEVQTAPNTTEDADLLIEALPGLKARTGVNTLDTDAGFCSPAADQVLRAHHVIQVPTALQGPAPNPARLALVDFHAQSDPQGIPRQLTCPQGQCVPVCPARKPPWYVAHFDTGVCQACPLLARCPTKPCGSKPWRALHFSQIQLDVAERRQRCAAQRQSGKNPRAAVEASIGAIKRPFSNDQVPVRGRFRVGVMMICSAVIVNVRRMQRHLIDKNGIEKETTNSPGSEAAPLQSRPSFLSALWRSWLRALAMDLRPEPAFALQ